jgi:pantothenate synthetase
VASRSASNKEVKKLVRKGRRIVTSRIDRLMLQLRKKAPELYNAYRTARKVVQPGTPSKEEIKVEVKKVA